METISDRIFELLREQKMSQKEFAKRTGIAESSISDWKKKRTNSVANKILIISRVLGVSPEYLLSGAEGTGTRSRENSMYVIMKDSELEQVADLWDMACHYAREEHEPKIHTVICFGGDEQFVHDVKEA